MKKNQDLKVVDLAHPFVFEKVEYSQFTFPNRCTAFHCGHINFIKGVDIDAQRVPILAKMTGLGEGAIREMDPRDFIEPRQIVNDAITKIDVPDLKDGAVSLPYAYKLRFPFKIGDVQYKEITFKNCLTLGVVENIRLMTATWQTFFMPVAHMLGVTPTEVGQMDPRDFSICLQIFYPFWQGGL